MKLNEKQDRKKVRLTDNDCVVICVQIEEIRSPFVWKVFLSSETNQNELKSIR